MGLWISGDGNSHSPGQCRLTPAAWIPPPTQGPEGKVQWLPRFGCPSPYVGTRMWANGKPCVLVGDMIEMPSPAFTLFQALQENINQALLSEFNPWGQKPEARSVAERGWGWAESSGTWQSSQPVCPERMHVPDHIVPRYRSENTGSAPMSLSTWGNWNQGVKLREGSWQDSPRNIRPQSSVKGDFLKKWKTEHIMKENETVVTGRLNFMKSQIKGLEIR